MGRTLKLLGYDIGVISGTITAIIDDIGLSTFQAEVVVGSLNLVSAFGGLGAGTLADCFGRKMMLALAAGTFVVGTAIMCKATSFSSLLLGRIIMGLGVGKAIKIHFKLSAIKNIDQKNKQRSPYRHTPALVSGS